VKDWYLLPLSADIINRLAGAKFFTKFDVRWGYNNVRIRKGDKWKAAFTTNRGLFKPLVMFFGLTNSPATFQALMNSIFADLIAKGVVAVYLDDILIYTKTIKEHCEITREVLCRLEENNLYLRPANMDPAKVQAVTDWPSPRNLKDVRGFLGFANFYRRFIEGFARIARPLNDLTKKDAPWSWGPSQQGAFSELKARFTSSPVLVMWQPDLETRMEVDALAFAMGGVISQKQASDGLHHPIAFRSESLSEPERNYEIYDRELPAIVRGLEDWRHYLIGLPEPFTIATDHRSLEYWTKARNLNRRQAWWYLTLAEYNFTLVHKPGSSMIVSDLMSQDPAKRVMDAEDNRDVVMLKSEHFRSVAAAHFASAEERKLEERIRRASQKDAEVLEGLKDLKSKGLRKMLDGTFEWEEEDGLVYFRGKLYIPPDVALRWDIVKSCRDAPTAGHCSKDLPPNNNKHTKMEVIPSYQSSGPKSTLSDLSKRAAITRQQLKY
jgi:hypothetical protein